MNKELIKYKEQLIKNGFMVLDETGKIKDLATKSEVIESIKKGRVNPGIERLFSFWNEKIIVNLSKFHYNKKVLESIDEIDKRILNIEQIIPKKKDSWAQFPNTLIQSIWGMSGVFVFSVYLC